MSTSTDVVLLLLNLKTQKNTMKGKISILLLSLLAFSSLQAQEMTADELIKSSIETLGGAEALAALESLKMTAVVSMGPMELPGTLHSARPNKQHFNINVQGKTLIQAYDGETAWMINPFQGGESAQKMPEEEAKEFTEGSFEAEYIDYAKKGHKVELEGKETIEGTETYKLKLTKENGTVEYHYFDSELFVPIMQSTAMMSGPQKGQFSQTFMSDYQEVNGVMMPYYMETKVNGESFQKITMETIEANIEIEEGLFSMPASEGEAAPTEEMSPEAPSKPEPPTAEEVKETAKKEGKKMRAKKKKKAKN